MLINKTSGTVLAVAFIGTFLLLTYLLLAKKPPSRRARVTAVGLYVVIAAFYVVGIVMLVRA